MSKPVQQTSPVPQTTLPKAALDAAATAVCERRNASDWPCNGLDFDEEMARAAVIAFLRALDPAPEFRSNGGFFVAGSSGFGLEVTTLHDLTAAVERACRAA